MYFHDALILDFPWDDKVLGARHIRAMKGELISIHFRLSLSFIKMLYCVFGFRPAGDTTTGSVGLRVACRDLTKNMGGGDRRASPRILLTPLGNKITKSLSVMRRANEHSSGYRE